MFGSTKQQMTLAILKNLDSDGLVLLVVGLGGGGLLLVEGDVGLLLAGALQTSVETESDNSDDDDDGNNEDDVNPNRSARSLLDGERDDGVDGSTDVVAAGDGEGLGGLDVGGLADDGTGGGDDGETVEEGWGDAASVVGGLDDGDEVGVGALVEDEGGVAVVDGDGGLDDAVVLLSGAQHSVDALLGVGATVVGGAGLVGVGALDGGAVAVLGGAGDDGVAEEEADLGELGAAGAAGVVDVEGAVVALGDVESVAVVGLVVVEGEGLALAVAGEDLVSGLVEDGPGLAVVGGLESPAAGVALVAVVGAEDLVGGDELLAVVLEGVLEGDAVAAGLAGLGQNVVIPDLVVALVAALLGNAAGNAVVDSVGLIGEEAEGGLEGVAGGDGGVVVDLDGEDVDAGVDGVEGEGEGVVEGGDAGSLADGDGVAGDFALGHVASEDLLAVEVDDDTGGHVDGKLDAGVAVSAAAVVEGGTVVLGDGGGHRDGAGDSGGPAGVVEGEGLPGRHGGAAVEVLPLGVDGGHEVAGVEGDGLGGLVHGDGAGGDELVGAVVDLELAGTPAGGDLGGEHEVVEAVGLAERVAEGGVLGEIGSGVDDLAGAVGVEGPLHVAGLVGGHDDGHDAVGGGAVEDSETEGGEAVDAEVVGGGDGVGGAGHGGGGDAVDSAVVGIHLQGVGEGRGDSVLGVDLRGLAHLGDVLADVGGGVAGGGGEGGGVEGVEVLDHDLPLGEADVAVGGVAGGAELHLELVPGLALLGDEEALALVAGLPGDAALGGELGVGGAVVGGGDGPGGGVHAGLLVGVGDAVLVDVAGSAVGVADVDPGGGAGGHGGSPVGVHSEVVEAVGGAAGGAVVGEAVGVAELGGLGHESQGEAHIDGAEGVAGVTDDGDGEVVGAGVDGGELVGDLSVDEVEVLAEGVGGAGDLAAGEVVAVDLDAVEVEEVGLAALDGDVEAVVVGEGVDGEGGTEEVDVLAADVGDAGGEVLPGAVGEADAVPVGGGAEGLDVSEELQGAAGVDEVLGVDVVGDGVTGPEGGDTDSLVAVGGLVEADDEKGSGGPATIGLIDKDDLPVAGGVADLEGLIDVIGRTSVLLLDEDVVLVVDSPDFGVGELLVSLKDLDFSIEGLLALGLGQNYELEGRRIAYPQRRRGGKAGTSFLEIQEKNK